MKSVFDVLNAINVNEHTEKKNGLTYLSWAWAWAELKKQYPNATYEVEMFDGLPYIYDEKTGYMVFTNMTIDSLNHKMWLPVMNSANKAMKATPYKWVDKYKKEHLVEPATMFDINTAIMRCLTKNISMFGLGLYIYSGEDIPESDEPIKSNEPEKVESATQTDEEVAVARSVMYKKEKKDINQLRDEVNDLLIAGDANVPKFFAYFGVNGVEDMDDVQCAEAIPMLKACQKKGKK